MLLCFLAACGAEAKKLKPMLLDLVSGLLLNGSDGCAQINDYHFSCFQCSTDGMGCQVAANFSDKYWTKGDKYGIVLMG